MAWLFYSLKDDIYLVMTEPLLVQHRGIFDTLHMLALRGVVFIL